MAPLPVSPDLVSTGISELDHVLRGGLPQGMVYLVHGEAGTGKTTLGFQFLREGVRRGERVLYASLLQTRRELNMIMASHGWTLDGIDLLELPENVRRASTDEQTMFSPGEVELQEVTEAILAAFRRYRPDRMVFDSITELAVLVDSPYQLRRQMLKLKQQFHDASCTTLFTVNDTEAVDLPSIQTAVHGVLEMGIERPSYGPTRHWVEISKMRGVNFLTGQHDVRIETGGIRVFPRMEVKPATSRKAWTTISSGNEALDALFGGGLEKGTACLITGTTGAGKTSLASLYVDAAAERGERCIIFCFDERKQTFIQRSEGLGIKIGHYIEKGLVDLRQINIGTLTPGEFAWEIQSAVTNQNVQVVVIDSISGYFHAMPQQRQLLVQLHELLSFLGDAGVLTIMMVPTHGLGGAADAGLDVNTSYIADTVVLMRHFEAMGHIRRCVSVLKKRYGFHESTIREVTMGSNGVQVGQPLEGFQGVLQGAPTFVGDQKMLMARGEDHHGASLRESE